MDRWNGGEALAIIGTGGFAREVACLAIDVLGDVALAKKLLCFVEKDECAKESTIWGIPVLRESEFVPFSRSIAVAIGDPSIRARVVASLPKDVVFATLVHPNVVISPFVELGEGAIVCAGAVLTCDIKVGRHAHMNLGSSVGHDCNIGDFFTTAPGVRVSGHCTIGNRVYFGNNAAIREGTQVVDDVTIGMGAVVVKPIVSSGVYIGNPAHRLESK